jgi:hypothetical protein
VWCGVVSVPKRRYQSVLASDEDREKRVSGQALLPPKQVAPPLK